MSNQESASAHDGCCAERNQRALRQHLARCPDDARARIQLGHLLHAHGNYAAARAQLEHAALLQPLPFLTQTELAECSLRTRDRQTATAIVRYLAEQRFQLGQAELTRTLQMGLRLRLVSVVQDCGRAGRERFPQEAVYWYAGGFVARAKRIPESAEYYFDAACQLEPTNTLYRIALSRQQIQLGDLAAARATLTLDVQSVDSLPQLIRLKSLYTELGETDSVYACVSELYRFHCP